MAIGLICYFIIKQTVLEVDGKSHLIIMEKNTQKNILIERNFKKSWLENS